MYQAIIFDMDGVIFDTEDFYLERRKQFLDNHGLSIAHMEAKEFIGGNLQQVWQKLLSQNTVKLDAKVIQEDYEAYKEKHPAPYSDLLFPQVKLILKQLRDKGYKLALASNSQTRDVHRALTSSEIMSYFDLVLGREDVVNAKPNPEIYKKAAQLLEVDKEAILVVEDSEKGIAAAKEAGITVLAIKDYRYGIDQSAANGQIDDLSGLLEVLK
ncbi:HAD family hydrolase [Streptococcus porcinus]|uniref:Haloacid dehalogenase n=2 Tax=Streptococcus porcinus TaxID=1340 RepID=A0A4V0H9F4_STRPO|nr:HAD family phosphatase [Streptococcus porcinus]EGJ27209.1 HAD hydrolase, family IA, variant 3 [Streptococcus porcinus str. Jelinkova 176]SQG44638.1 haloacid dehalogenase [Streptococcus porcinus]VTT44748.1 haloacid dehalogenase [Streptococcus porcinus]VTT46155.1 haloacid dehalogenase [Streptococcus porcinus]